MSQSDEKIFTESTFYDFSHVLNVPFIYYAKECFFSFYSKIHSFSDVPGIIPAIYTAFMFIQVAMPQIMFVVIKDNPDDTISSILKLFSVLWSFGSAYGENARFYVTIIFIILNILNLAFISRRSVVYKNEKYVSEKEMTIILCISKYIFPVTITPVVAAIPQMIYKISLGENTILYSILVVIGILLVLIIIAYIFAYFNPRIMFLKEFLHEWESLTAAMISFATCIHTALVFALPYCSKIGCLVIGIVQILLDMFYGYKIYKSRMYVYPKTVLVVSTFFSALAYVSIINCVSVYVSVKTIFVLVTFILAIVIEFMFFQLLESKCIPKYLEDIEQLDENPEIVSPSRLAHEIRATVAYCPPNVFTWTPIEKALQKEKNDDLLLVYARLVSSFPHFNYMLRNIISRIKNSDLTTKRTLQLQLESIILRRSTSATPEMVQFFNSADNYKKIIDKSTLQFWESVIQGSTDKFWSEIDNRDEYIDNLLRDLEQMQSTYENSLEVLSVVIKSHKNMTYRYDEIAPLQSSLDVLQSGSPAHPDRALVKFLSMFPEAASISPFFSEDIIIAARPLDNDDALNEKFNQKQQIHSIIKSSSLGTVFPMTIYLLLATVLVIIVSVFYMKSVQTNITNSLSEVTETFLQVNALEYDLTRWALLTYESQLFTKSSTFLKNDDAMMEIISPNWYSSPPYLPRFNITSEELQNLSSSVRSDLENIGECLSNLNSFGGAAASFITKFNNELVPETNKTISLSIVDLLLTPTVDEEFVDNVNSIYNKLKSDIATFSEDVSFDDQLTSTNNYMVLFVLCSIILISFPVMLRLFFITTQMNEIAKAFSLIPSNEIKKSFITDEEDDESAKKANVLIPTRQSDDYFAILLYAMLITTIPPVLISFILFIYSQTYIDETEVYCKGAAYLRTGVATIRMTFLYMSLAFENAYDENGYITGSDAYPVVVKAMNTVSEMISVSSEDVTRSLLKTATQTHPWLAIEDEYRSFDYPLNEDYNTIPADGYEFERLAFQKWTHAEDNIIFFMKMAGPGKAHSIEYHHAQAYYLWWGYNEREVPYFSTVINQLRDDISTIGLSTILFIVMCVIQIITFYSLILIFRSLKKKMQNAMLMLMQLSPDVVLKNAPIMSILIDGRFVTSDEDNFQHSDCYINYSKDAICVVDKNLKISDKNPAFDALLPGIKNFKDIQASPNEKSFTPQALNVCIHEIFEGKEPRASRKMTALVDDKEVYFNVEVIGYADYRILFENDSLKPESCVIIINDITNIILTEKSIDEKNNDVQEMLKNVLPQVIITELLKGSSSISFSVHSATLCEIKVGASKRFSFSSKEPHMFYNQVYKIFDKVLENYPTLTKLRTFAHGYTVAGGIFMTVNKPEKHAEETIRFSLELLRKLPVISKECNTEVNLTIGVHTGGPIVAGVMSIDLPSFVVLGNVRKYSQEMKASGDKNSIHMTRSVYELIFSAGFNIVESESSTIGKEVIATYSIYP